MLLLALSTASNTGKYLRIKYFDALTKAKFDIMRTEYSIPKKAFFECILLLLYDLRDIRKIYQCTILQVLRRRNVSLENNI